MLDLRSSNPGWTGSSHAAIFPPHARRLLASRRQRRHARLHPMRDRNQTSTSTTQGAKAHNCMRRSRRHIGRRYHAHRHMPQHRCICASFSTTHRTNTQHHCNDSAVNVPRLSIRGHTPFADGPVIGPCTIQHRGTATFHVTCNVFGIGLYDTEYDIQTLSAWCSRISDGTTTTPRRISALALSTCQDAVDAAQHTGTNKPPPSQHDDRPLQPNHTQERHSEAKRPSKSSNGRTQNAHGTPRGRNDAGDHAGSSKPTWQVEGTHAKNETVHDTASFSISKATHQRALACPIPPTQNARRTATATTADSLRDNASQRPEEQGPDLQQDPPDAHTKTHNQNTQQLDSSDGSETLDMCPQVTDACIAATTPGKVRELIHTAIQPHLHELLAEQGTLAFTQCVRKAIASTDTSEMIAIMRSTVLLPGIASRAITAERERICATRIIEQDRSRPTPVGGDAIEAEDEQCATAGQAVRAIPCPYAWADHKQQSYRGTEGKKAVAWDAFLAQARANIAGAIACIHDESATVNP